MEQSLTSQGRARTILLHVAGWLILFVTPLLLSPPNEMESALTDASGLGSLALRNLVLMGLFYFNFFYLTPRVLQIKGVGYFLLAILPLVILVSFANWQIHHLLAESMPPPFDGGPGGPPQGPPEFGPGRGHGPPFGRRPMMMASSLFASFLITLIVTSISTTLVLWQDVARAKAIEQERALQRVASELAVLKLQISPHFLFNTLNNIRWLVRSKSDRAEEAVMKLSQLLRYVLYQTNEEDVPLDKEIGNLKDYVDLQLLRLPEAGSLSLTITDETGQYRIAPLLLLPIVENLFKYGDFSPGFVNSIEIIVSNGRLHLETINRVAPQQSSETKEDSGIGLTNLRKRLTLHYPDRYEFSFGLNKEFFEVKLDILLT